MKDNLTLIAAATGGFMLSVALAGIIHGAPITASSLQGHHNVHSTSVTAVSLASADTKKLGNEE